MSRLRAHRARRAIAVVLLALALPARASAARPPAAPAPAPRVAAPSSAADADALLLTPASPARDRALAEWARRAQANDLAWLLRHGPAELGSAERVLVEAALDGTPAERTELRQRLLARAAVAVPRAAAKRAEPPLPDLSALRPYASVFRIGLVLPDSGEYASYRQVVRVALAEGLAWGRAKGAPAFVIDTTGTGDSDPARLTAALLGLAPRCDVVVGEILSAPTLALAVGASLAGLTLVSPTATDERIGRAGPRVLQAIPCARVRARALARAVLEGTPHKVVVTGSAAGVRGAFAQAFVAEVESRGGRVVRREALRTNATDLANQVNAIEASGADVLFWDGGARDAETLVKALASEGVAVRLCGGPALSPESARPAARSLLEGVAWVDDDWRLPAPERARLDTLALALGVRAGSLMTRGFLCGQLIAAAVDGGARTAGEVAAALRHRDPALAAAGVLEPERAGATLAVYVVRNGRTVPAIGPQ